MGPADSTQTDNNVQGEGRRAAKQTKSTHKDHTNPTKQYTKKSSKTKRTDRSGNEEEGGSDREGVSRQEKGELSNYLWRACYQCTVLLVYVLGFGSLHSGI